MFPQAQYEYRIRQLLIPAPQNWRLSISTQQVLILQQHAQQPEQVALIQTVKTFLYFPIHLHLYTNLVIETPYAVSQMTIVIHDSKGRLMHQLKTSKGSGKTTIEIPYLKFGKGKYYITIYNDKKVISTEEWIKL